MAPSSKTTRILLIRPSALGDVVRTVPVLVSLRRAHPDAHIDWLVQDDFQEAIAHHPDLSRVIPFPRRAFGHQLTRGQFGPFRAFLRELRETQYDIVYDLQGLARSGMMTHATRAPRRIGFADAREFGWLGLTERIPVSADMHTVERMLALTHASGVPPVRDMRLYVSDKDRLGILADPDLPSDGYAVLAPGSRWPGKRWPDERFAAIAQHLVRRGLKVCLVGSRSERDHASRCLDLADRTPKIIDRMGKTTIGQLMAIIRFSAMVIANDSAALHIAVGFDRPSIALFGPTRVDRVGPYRREADVIQHIEPEDDLNHKHAASGLALMKRITVEEVMLRIDSMLLSDDVAELGDIDDVGDIDTN
ncbi:MAG: glycosyltransferase family 9 protein [Planctomycetes bacterium]|nr:glycosyltransferase family 9 protein [Planctomycetota bacterium]